MSLRIYSKRLSRQHSHCPPPSPSPSHSKTIFWSKPPSSEHIDSQEAQSATCEGVNIAKFSYFSQFSRYCQAFFMNFTIFAGYCHYVYICETQPPASISWVAPSSMFVVRRLSRIGHTSSHLHYMMFQTIQTIYFLWAYDPGNMSVSFALYSLLSWAQFTVV